MKNFPIVKSRRLRSTPYTDRIEAHGVSSYTVYNHMLLPSSFKSTFIETPAAARNCSLIKGTKLTITVSPILYDFKV